MGTILLIIVILLLLGAIPSWPHRRGWGITRAGASGWWLVILIVLILMRQVPWGL